MPRRSPWPPRLLALALAALAPLAPGAERAGRTTSNRPPPGPLARSLKTAERCRDDRDCTSRFADLDRWRCEEKDARVEAVDLNQDGKPEVWKIHHRVRLAGKLVEVQTCRRLDLDGDGRVDVSIHYDPRGSEEIREQDVDQDGQVDLIHVLPTPRTASPIRHRVGPGTTCRVGRCEVATP